MSQISSDKVVQFHYTLSDTNNNPIETSREGEPMAYLHGHDNMIPALEQALEGKQPGDCLTLTLSPEESYGERQDGLEMRIPTKHLNGLPKGAKSWQPGMTAVVKTDQGMRQVTVIKPGRHMVLVDGNHPLAGKTLTYELEVVDVRDATDEEIAHGHAHGAGGHHH